MRDKRSMTGRSTVDTFTGLWNIVPTPFDDTGVIDTASIDTLVEFVIGSGVTGMTILGVAGEAAKLTEAERLLVIERMIARADGRVPVCVGVSGGSTFAALDNARVAVAAGAHSLLLAVPVGLSQNDDVITDYYLKVANSVNVEVVIQDHPNHTGVRLSVDLLTKLTAAAPNLQVIKLEATPSPPKVAQLHKALPNINILGGLGGRVLIEELRHGAVGTMTGVGIPEVLSEVIRKHHSGDIEGAIELFYRYCPLLRFENQEPGLSLSIRKQVYQRRGIIKSAHVRTPGRALDPTTISDLDDILRRLGIVKS